jgi:hypothetical protein
MGYAQTLIDLNEAQLRQEQCVRRRQFRRKVLRALSQAANQLRQVGSRMPMYCGR